jgi:hypothetical protein
MQRPYSYLPDAGRPVPVPPPSLNGGLYTGEPFGPADPHRNFPAAPDAAYLTFHNLRSAAPPPDAVCQPPAGGGMRPGNNAAGIDLPHLRPYGPEHAFSCVADGCPMSAQAARGTARYAYLG